MKTTLLNKSQISAAKTNLYYAEAINQRVKIIHVNTSGLCVIKCKDGTHRNAYIADLKRVY